MGCNIAIDGPAGAGKEHNCKESSERIIFYLCGYRSHVQGNGVISSEPGHQTEMSRKTDREQNVRELIFLLNIKTENRS